MMQFARRLSECYNLNALLFLQILILHDRFFTVFGVIVSSHELAAARVSEEYVESQPSHFDSEVHELNNVDINQFSNGFSKLTGSQEVVDFASPPFGPKFESLGNKVSQSADPFNEFVKLFSLHHSTYELPNFFNNRIAITSRIVTPASQLPFPVRAKIVRPAPSPLAAITEGVKDRLKAIYPGTLWCGDGNQAKSQNEIGLFRNTDICCKQHDECPSFIKSGSEFKGLRNTGLFTRSHCDCDMKFFNCLKRTDSLISNKIGLTYFNILRPQCFRKEFPIVGCKKWVNKKCVVYMVDDQQPGVWQWFENNFY